MATPEQPDFKAQLNTIDFHGQVLQIIDGNGRPYVPIKRICINLGLDWEGQRQRIERDQVLSEGACMIQVPSAGGEQEMLCLPLEYLNGWLFGIDERRVAPQIKDALVMYKREAYGALYNYFVKGFAIDRKRLDEDEIARDAALEELRKLRTSDRTLYKKITDAIAKTSEDYEYAKTHSPKRLSGLFARIQDTFHYAVSGKTAAELVIDHADGTKPLVGMVSYDGDPDDITVQDVRTGKNYLNKTSFRKLEILYELLFLFAENRILSGDKLTLDKWEDQLQKLLVANGYEPWGMYRFYVAPDADRVAKQQHKIYKERRPLEKAREEFKNRVSDANRDPRSTS